MLLKGLLLRRPVIPAAAMAKADGRDGDAGWTTVLGCATPSTVDGGLPLIFSYRVVLPACRKDLGETFASSSDKASGTLTLVVTGSAPRSMEKPLLPLMMEYWILFVVYTCRQCLSKLSSAFFLMVKYIGTIVKQEEPPAGGRNGKQSTVGRLRPRVRFTIQ